MNEDFNSLVELFKKMSYKDKKDVLIDEFKKTVAAIEKLNVDINNKHEMLINRELIDVNKNDATDDDYLEAYYVYLNMINDGVFSFSKKISGDFFEEENVDNDLITNMSYNMKEREEIN